MSMKIIEEKEVLERLSMEKCMELMKSALMDLETGKGMQPMRNVIRLPHGNLFGFMSAYLGDGDCFGAKILTAFPGNAGTQYPSHIGYVMMFDAEHGTVLGMADANAITMIRTGAVSGVATELLSREDASHLAIIGAGAQGRSHLEAIRLVRDIKKVTVYDISKTQAEKFAADSKERFGIDVVICDDVESCVKDADIICTVTPSKEAYLKAEWVKKGAHINAVGTFSPDKREVTSQLMAASKLYADQVEALKKESGEYLVPLQEGLITEDHVVGSIGQVLLGKAPAREDEAEITLFDALGLAMEDVMCGKYLCKE